MRTAIVHYWLLNSRGGEAVLEGLCRLVPDADLFTLFYDPKNIRPTIRSHRVQVSFLNPLRRWYRELLPLMPLALESFDLSGYDLVISSESGPAKGVLVPSQARHICYCHTPMRYLWELYPQYVREFAHSRLKGALMAPVSNYLRLWDYATAARVDEFIANSENVRQRIWRCYRRHAEVVYPPVAVETFRWEAPEDFYLVVSELVAYKRIDRAVQIFSRTGRKLRIVGDGPEYRRLRGLATGSVEFCGRISDDALREMYARCRALVIPGEEDFGITAVEAMASGKPVIALGRGGVLESVTHEGGVLYREPDEAHLQRAVEQFERDERMFQPGDLQRRATRFSQAEFARKMGAVLAGSSPERTQQDPDIRAEAANA
jgi:glycosyltransferase involved in cell wall biosynthesis